LPELLRSRPQEIDDPADGRGQVDHIGLAILAAVEALFDGVDDSTLYGQTGRTRSAAGGDPSTEAGPAQRHPQPPPPQTPAPTLPADQTAADDADVFELAHSALSTADAIRRS